ncbi:LOW QUALITY PROTEIN: hypothetical protein U9M48_023349 [Paspalum notatum var. saurae]|uniref:Reverse transcriptase zinc-binding domain-containing protein n=1 Tax=Paspalum notatum var. saurae TaxID=547442 RepID=A0AAQ3TN49_PASNO
MNHGGRTLFKSKMLRVIQIQQYKPVCLLNKQNGVIFKIDFEKSYDKMRWDFLHQALRMKGFSPLWCTWGGNVGVKVNDQIGSYFQTQKGLRQEDPLSPILFNFVLSSLKINFHKSEVGVLPFRYFGIPMHFRKLRNKDWKPLEDRLEKKLRKVLSFGGSLVLHFVLSSFPMLLISFFEIPRGVLKRLITIGPDFFWQNGNHKKYRLIKWLLICLPKELGGLGVKNLDVQNKCLLRLWQGLIRNKYLKRKPQVQVEKKIAGENQLRFWEDVCLGNHALKLIYPNLLNIVRKKHATVAEIFRSFPLNISFRRALEGIKLLEWHDLVAKLSNVNIEEGNDTFVWGLHKSGSFSANSMYNALISNRIKIFLWFLKKGVLLAKDNLKKRNWKGIINSEFCSKPKSIQHLFFDCHYAKWLKQGGQNKVGLLLAGAAALCWAIWLTRNDFVFNKCKRKYVLHALFNILASFLGSVRTEDKKDEVVQICKILEVSTMEIYASFGWPFTFRIEL